jgi:hypothetical protein
LVVSGLLERQGDGFANAPEAAAFLVKGRAGYMGGVHELWSQLWHADLLTARSIREGQPAALHDFTAASDQEVTTMLRGMHAASSAAGRDLVRRFDLSGCRSVIDVGGGSGGLIAALCAAHPDLRGTLLDLPRNAALAEPILRATPGGERVSIEMGDILEASPRDVHDVLVMRALIQVLSAGDAARAVANTTAAVRPGGTIYILGGGILDDDRLGPDPAVFWNITFMNLYPSGASQTLKAIYLKYGIGYRLSRFQTGPNEADWLVVVTYADAAAYEKAQALFPQDDQLQQVFIEIAKFAKRISREMVVDLEL